jgi:hypothetical protein
VSNRDRAALAASITPYRPVLRSGIGFIDSMKNFDEVDLKPGPEYRWDLTSHLAAISEEDRQVAFLPNSPGNDQACLSWNLFTGPHDSDCHLVADDPNEIDYVYDENTGGLLAQFRSEFRDGRTFRTSDLTEHYLDLCFRPDKVVETPMVNESYDWLRKCVFTEKNKLSDIIEIADVAKLDDTNSFEAAYFPDDQSFRQSELSFKRVPITRLIGYGTHFARPILRAYIRLETNSLFVADEGVLKYIFSFLGLTPRLERRNRMAVTLSYNAFLRAYILDQAIPREELVKRIISLSTPIVTEE